jgi:hypothetical protein
MTDYSTGGTGPVGDWRTRWGTDSSELLTKILFAENPIFPPFQDRPQQIPGYGDSVRQGADLLAQYLKEASGPWTLAGYSQWDDVNGYRRYLPFDDGLDHARTVFDELCRDLNGRVIVPQSQEDRYDLPYGPEEDGSKEGPTP